MEKWIVWAFWTNPIAINLMHFHHTAMNWNFFLFSRKFYYLDLIWFNVNWFDDIKLQLTNRWNVIDQKVKRSIYNAIKIATFHWMFCLHSAFFPFHFFFVQILLWMYFPFKLNWLISGLHSCPTLQFKLRMKKITFFFLER